VRQTFGADDPFAGISWLERPEERPALPGTFHLDSADRDSKASRLLVHDGETTFIGRCTAAEHDRLACLAMEYRIGLSATCQDQYHEEHESLGHKPVLSHIGMNLSKNATFLTRVIEVAVYAVYHA
jgi:hypothetical protein